MGEQISDDLLLDIGNAGERANGFTPLGSLPRNYRKYLLGLFSRYDEITGRALQEARLVALQDELKRAASELAARDKIIAALRRLLDRVAKEDSSAKAASCLTDSDVLGVKVGEAIKATEKPASRDGAFLRNVWPRGW